MSMLQAIILGVVQGATEFIPVSSSAHLVLVPWWFGWNNPGLAFDAVLHLGTLLAVMAVFWRDLLVLAVDLWNSVRRRPADAAQAMVAWGILVGTLPAALMGALWEERFEALFHSPAHVSVLLLITGCWLVVAERWGRKARSIEQLRWIDALAIGVAQGCAIAPGISRSGATIGAGMLLGLQRRTATRYSFLLATPIVLGAGLLQTVRLLAAPGIGTAIPPLLLGLGASFMAGYACIRFLLAFVSKRGLTAMACYCWVVGLASIARYAGH